MLSRGDDRQQRGDDVTGHALWSFSAGAVAPTLVRLSSSVPGVPEGEPLALAAQVVTMTASSEPATGTVSFAVDGRLVGSAVLDGSGQAVLDGVHLAVGVHAVVASYSGDDRHAAASSAPLPQAVTAAALPVVVLVPSPVATPSGVRLEAEVAELRTGRVAEDATGTVVFTAGGTLLGTAELRQGSASLDVTALPPGRLRVSYQGDAEHASAVGVAPADAL